MKSSNLSHFKANSRNSRTSEYLLVVEDGGGEVSEQVVRVAKVTTRPALRRPVF